MELQWIWKVLSWNVEVVEKSIWYRLGPLWAKSLRVADPTLSANSCGLLIGSALGALSRHLQMPNAPLNVYLS